MPVVPFGRRFHSRTANWRSAQRNRGALMNRAGQTFSSCVSTATPIAPIAVAAIEAEMWDDRAVEIWRVNYPGFGGSTGPARLSRIGPAALSAFDELKHHANGRPIVPFGTSIGATAALHLAASRPGRIDGVILQNPPPLREMILRQFGWWNLWLLAGPVALQMPRDLDSIINARTSRAPAIFLLAERDEVVAPRFHRLVVDAYAGEKRVIALRGAYHNDPIEGQR
jgi:pimeloyl-ACP methyl ester carboxylesterase